MCIIVEKNYNKKLDDGTIVVMRYIEASGDSSETKPTKNIVDGSIFVESNTGDVSLFNEKTSSWIPQFSFKG